MTIPQTVAEILRHHVKLEVEGIDRMYLNVYVPALQRVLGVVGFFRNHRGEVYAASPLMDRMTKPFVAGIERFAKDHGIEVVTFEKGQRKDDVMKTRLKSFTAKDGVVFIGKAQEKAKVLRTQKRKNPTTGQSYPWLVPSTAMGSMTYDLRRLPHRSWRLEDCQLSTMNCRRRLGRTVKRDSLRSNMDAQDD
jgi:hypothetical protein